MFTWTLPKVGGGGGWKIQKRKAYTNSLLPKHRDFKHVVRDLLLDYVSALLHIPSSEQISDSGGLPIVAWCMIKQTGKSQDDIQVSFQITIAGIETI